MTNAKLAAIKAREEKATPGPWKVTGDGVVLTSDGMTPTGVCSNAFDSRARNSHNAEFIAHAREDIPALVAEVERLRDAAEAVLTCRWPLDSKSVTTGAWFDGLQAAIDALDAALAGGEEP